MTLIATTERLTIRTFELSDAPFILELVNDPDWLRFIGDKGVRSLDDARQYLQSGPIAMFRQRGHALYRVALRTDDTPIGACGLLQRDWLPHPDLGFALLPAWRRQGYTREASVAVLHWADQVLGKPPIYANTDPENHASQALLTSLGFDFIGRGDTPDDHPTHCYRRG